MPLDTSFRSNRTPSPQEDALLDFASVLHQLDKAATPAVTSNALQGNGANTELRTEPTVRPPTRSAFSRIVRLLKASSAEVAAPISSTTARLVVTDRWEGVVTEVHGDTFEGEFVPVGAQQPRLRAIFLISEVEPDDLELVRLGALFYVIASRIQVSARRWQPSSAIQFRRLPRPTEDDGVEATQRARKLRQKLGLEG
jgi:hypothetical protein